MIEDFSVSVMAKVSRNIDTGRNRHMFFQLFLIMLVQHSVSTKWISLDDPGTERLDSYIYGKH